VAIQYAVMPAYSALGNTAGRKQILSAQVISTINDPTNFNIQGHADFTIPELSPVNPPVEELPAVWDIAEWNVASWARDQRTFNTKGWQNCSAFGWSVAFSCRFAKASSPVVIRQFNLQYRDTGGF